MIEPSAVMRVLLTGRRNGVHMRELAAKLFGHGAGDFEQRKVRELITELRREGTPICGTPDSGYFLASTPDELDETCGFLLGRAETTVAIVAAMKQTATPDLRGQLGLPDIDRADQGGKDVCKIV